MRLRATENIRKAYGNRPIAWFYVFLITVFVIVFDRLTKAFVLRNMSEGQSVKILQNIFHITLVFNTGTAFGLLKGGSLLFVPVSFLVISLIIIYIFKKRVTDVIISSALGLVLGGAIGNLFDRIEFGHVIDFLDFRIWPVFNIADSCITVGAFLLILKIILSETKAKG